MWTRIICPPLLILDLIMAIRRMLHLGFIFSICAMYHKATRTQSGPFAAEISEFLSKRPTKHSNGAANGADRVTAIEIGSGPFPMLDAYPRGTRLVCIDPSSEFNDKLNEAWEGSHLKGNGELIIHNTFAEDLEGVIFDGMADVVVTRMVNCSVADMDLSFKQICRILKPGGRYYFWDHIKSENPFVVPIQYLLTFLPVLAFFSNCTLVRRPYERMSAAGFSDVQVQKKQMNIGMIFRPYSETAIGYATK